METAKDPLTETHLVSNIHLLCLWSVAEMSRHVCVVDLTLSEYWCLHFVAQGSVDIFKRIPIDFKLFSLIMLILLKHLTLYCWGVGHG